MHMMATNLCEWLYVLVEETKQDILSTQELREDSFTGSGADKLLGPQIRPQEPYLRIKIDMN